MTQVRHVVHVYRRTSRSWTVHVLAFRSEEAALHAAGWLVGPGDGSVAIRIDHETGGEVHATFGTLPPEYDTVLAGNEPPFPAPILPYRLRVVSA